MTNRRNIICIDRIIKDHIKIHDFLEKNDIDAYAYKDKYMTKDGRLFKVKIVYESIK